MAIRDKDDLGKIVIDLTGPQGNAFYIMAVAQKLAKDLGYSTDQIQKLLADMKSSDYNNLLSVIDKEFGEFIVFYR
jgi:hypothetical protein